MSLLLGGLFAENTSRANGTNEKGSLNFPLGPESVSSGDRLEHSRIFEVLAREVGAYVGQLADQLRRCKAVALQLVEVNGRDVVLSQKRSDGPQECALARSPFAEKKDAFLPGPIGNHEVA